MNSLIILPEERLSPELGEIRGQRADELCELHELKVGIRIRAAELNGLRGEATVLEVSPGLLRLGLCLDTSPLPPNPLHLLIAVPRPQTVKKVLQSATSLGVQSIFFSGTERGIKSYLQSKSLLPGAIRDEIITGLSQACDSVAPQVEICRSLKHLMRIRLAEQDWYPQALRLVAVTGEAPAQPLSSLKLQSSGQPAVIAIGPEAGWSIEEIELFQSAGFLAISLGPRILRVETAVCCLIAQLDMLRAINPR